MRSAHTINNTDNLLQVFVHRDFSAVRDQAMKMIQTAFTLLDQEFQKLDRYMSSTCLFSCIYIVGVTSLYIRIQMFIQVIRTFHMDVPSVTDTALLRYRLFDWFIDWLSPCNIYITTKLVLIFSQLNFFFCREKSELSKAAATLQREKEAHDAHRQQQQQVHQHLNPIQSS